VAFPRVDMPAASGFTTVSFSLLVLLVLAAVSLGTRRAGHSNTAILALAVPYLILPGLLARAGALNRYSPLPAPALLLIAILTILTAVLVLSAGSRLAASVPLGAVVTLQAFRIVVEWLLYRLYREGVVPVQMTYAGRNFDIISGLTGLVLGIWLLSGRPLPGSVLWAWNILGLGLLANIVVTAVLSTPAPFRLFLEGPPNLLPSTFPFVWLPSFLVQVAWGSHLLIFRQLRRRTSPA
jgi:hypothetical protein